MDSSDSFKFLLSVLKNIKLYTEGDEAVMITVTLTNNNSSYPPLYQVIKIDDKTYYTQHLAEHTHDTLESNVINSNDLLSLTLQFKNPIDISLTWGPYHLFNFEFNSANTI